MKNIESLIAVVFILFLFIVGAKFLYRLFRIDSEETISQLLSEEYNIASGVQFSGYLLSVLITLSSILHSNIFLHEYEVSKDLVKIISVVLANGFIAIISLVLFARITLFLILRIKIAKAIEADNVAAGILSGGIYVSIAIILAGILNGTDDFSYIFPNIVFFIVGVVTLWFAICLFRFLTKYNDTHEILNENNAAAISFTGVVIAIAVIISHGLHGEFYSYTDSLYLYCRSIAVILFLYPVRQWLVQGIFLRKGFHFYGGILDDEIAQHRNVVAGLIEAITYIGTSFIAVNLMI